jgi:hypothetical protein
LSKESPPPAAKRPRGRPRKPRTDPATAKLPFDRPVAQRNGEAPVPVAPPPIMLRHLAPAMVSDVYESYWRFAAERQAVFFRRACGEVRPWTSNAVLATYKFTNAYRASDRASQYLIRRVIYRADLPNTPREVFFRILLFKLFNKIETWELLERSLGPITFEDYRFAPYDEVLARAMRDGRRIYSAAYIMPPGSSAFAEHRSERCAVVAPKIGNGFEIRLQMPQQPDHFQVAMRLRLQPPARTHPVQIAVDVKLQQIAGSIARAAVRLRHDTGEPGRRKVEPVNKGVDEANRVVGADIGVNRLGQKQHL